MDDNKIIAMFAGVDMADLVAVVNALVRNDGYSSEERMKLMALADSLQEARYTQWYDYWGFPHEEVE